MKLCHSMTVADAAIRYLFSFHISQATQSEVLTQLLSLSSYGRNGIQLLLTVCLSGARHFTGGFFYLLARFNSHNKP